MLESGKGIVNVADDAVKAGNDVLTAPTKLVAEGAKAVGLKSVANGIEAGQNIVTKATTDASKVIGQTVVAGADVATGQVKAAGAAISNAGNAAKDTAVDAVKAPTSIAATAADTIGMKSIGDALDTVGNATGDVVSKAADAAGNTIKAGADIAQGKVSAAGDDMKSAANNVASSAEDVSAIGLRTAGAAAGAVGMKSIQNEANKLANDTSKVVENGMDVMGHVSACRQQSFAASPNSRPFLWFTGRNGRHRWYTRERNGGAEGSQGRWAVDR